MRTNQGIWGVVLLSFIGIGLCAYLFFLHVGLLRGELLGGAACSAGVFNCHAVTSGAWSAVLGIPLSLWGLLGYLMIFALSLLALQSSGWAEDVRPLLFGLALCFVLIDLVLLSVMVVVIRFYCLFCLLTYLVNLTLLVVLWRSLGCAPSQALRRIGSSIAALLPSAQRPAAWCFWGLMVTGVLGAVGVHAATTFLTRGEPGAMRKQIGEFLTHQARVTVDVAGDPSLGPTDAAIQLVEFSDFFCPACQRASKMNTVVLASHRHDVRFIFKHYPLDTTCNSHVTRMVHPGACQVAAASECAHLQGKFWLFHDRVFEEGHTYKIAHLEIDAQQLGLDVERFTQCLASGEGLAAVKRDVEAGSKVGVTSTPSYVINGLPVAGGIQPAMFEEFVSALRHE